jgi:hypothetical protein
LTSPKFARDVDFFTANAYRYVEHERTPQATEAVGRLYGQPLYRETLIRRRKTMSPHLWVSNRLEKSYDHTANRFVAGFLHQLVGVGERHVRNLPEHTKVTLRSVRRLLALPILREVLIDKNWLYESLPAQSISGNPFYRRAWRWTKGIRAAMTSYSADLLRSQLEGGWLQSTDEDKLFEVFVLGATLERVFAFGDWDDFRITGGAVVRGDLKAVARAKDLSIDVRFDSSMSTGSSGYLKIIGAYASLSGRARRPDIQLIVTRGQRTQHCLVEAKNADPTSDYARDSIYKVFGYLKDCSNLWAPADTFPHAILVLGNAVEPLESLGKRIQQEVIVTDPALIYDDIDGTIRAILAT